tara:strand:- start:31 stop:483 length:453 start_codon:yes stop_codon:yes gene_type:complete
MARIHARVKGKSGSNKPLKDTKITGAPSKAEVIKLIKSMAEQGMSSALIGLRLRDLHAVPSVKKITGSTISKIMKDNDMYSKVPEDLRNLVLRAITITKHLAKNKKDKTSTRGLALTESKIRRLQKYYQNSGKISKTWKYKREDAELLID